MDDKLSIIKSTNKKWRKNIMNKWKVLSIIIIMLVLLGFAVMGCTPSTAPETEEVQEEEPAAEEPSEEEPAAEEPAKEEPTVEEPAGFQGWEPGQIASEDYVTVVRKGEKPYVFGYGEGLASWELCATFREGFERVAEEAGVELVLCDNNYPDTEAPLNCARSFVSQGVDGVMSSLWVGDLTPAVMEIFDEANIPVVALDVEHPGAPFFGQDNCKVGTLAGEYAVEWTVEHWPDVAPEEMYVVPIENPDVGEVPLQRPRCFAKALKEAFPEIPDENFYVLPSDGSNEKVFESMSTWLTGHPDAKHVYLTAINTMESTGAAAAFEVAGRVEHGVIVGMEGTEASLAEIAKPDEETAYKGDVLFFPEKYAEYMIPMLMDMIEGNPVPEFYFMKNVVVNHDNYNELFPE